VALVALAGCGCPTVAEVGDEAFCVEIARTEAERRTGLRGRPDLAAGEGLLLRFPIEDELCIVNDGVAFPIDVLYADASGGIVAIERAVAAGDPTLRCHGPASDVLEVSAGALDAIGVTDRLTVR
jgi:uncharacterized membrane protein (UPF0127 family)